MVTALVGIVVAVVSAVFGIAAHGLAAGTGAAGTGAIPSAGQFLLVIAASAGVGAAAAALARQQSPLLTAAAGLVAGQGIVHLVLASGHTHAGTHTTAAGSAHSAFGHHLTDPAAVRAAMDSAAIDSASIGSAATGSATTGGAGFGAAADPATLLTPAMLGAHLAAIVITLALVAILSGTLAWVAARVVPLVGAVRLVVVAPLLASYDASAPRALFLLARGGTRAPPVAV